MDKFIPPMVLIDQALIAVKSGDIPKEPIWSQILDTGSIEHNDDITSTEQSQNTNKVLPKSIIRQMTIVP